MLVVVPSGMLLGLGLAEVACRLGTPIGHLRGAMAGVELVVTLWAGITLIRYGLALGREDRGEQ